MDFYCFAAYFFLGGGVRLGVWGYFSYWVFELTIGFLTVGCYIHWDKRFARFGSHVCCDVHVQDCLYPSSVIRHPPSL